MREIVLDTETTGLDPADGHRIIEIGCVELMDHLPTGVTFPALSQSRTGRGPDGLSQRVHGITDYIQADKPLFAHIVDELHEFLGDAPLIIHNASFDRK